MKKFHRAIVIISIILGITAINSNAIASGGLNEVVLKTIIGGLLQEDKDCVNYIEAGKKYYKK